MVGAVAGMSQYLPALIRASDYERLQRQAEDAASLRTRRGKLLLRLAALIEELEAFHKRFLRQANDSGAESAGMAAYLLLGRAIALLKVLNDALGSGHWYSGALIRDVDEGLELAHYFAITKDTGAGARNLLRWFRENEAPSNATCREAISKHRASLEIGASEQEHLELMRELYRKKSKWVHPTFAAIREVTQFQPGSRAVLAIDYGPCDYEGKLLELTAFFRSTVWSTYQTLFLCFHYTLTLCEKDRSALGGYDKMFSAWVDEARAGAVD